MGKTGDTLKRNFRVVCYALTFAIAASCGSAQHPPLSEDSRVQRLHAFARLYGVVRWFHPSDASAEVDWDQFAVTGAAASLGTPSEAFPETLHRLFAPVAPSIVIYQQGREKPRAPAEFRGKPSAAQDGGDPFVAWEHLGFGDTSIMTGYASKRRHRPRPLPVEGIAFASIWQAVDGHPLRGKNVRLRGKFRGARSGCGQLWLRVERASGVGFFDNMAKHAALGVGWTDGEIMGPVDPDAQRVVFGIYKDGATPCWYDDIRLEVERAGTWSEIAIKDAGFEVENLFSAWKPGLDRPSAKSTDGWELSLDSVMPAEGRASLKIRQKLQMTTDELFDDAPMANESVDLDLGMGLRAQVALSLPSRDGQTTDVRDNAKLRTHAVLESQSEGQTAHFIADVVVAWNTIQHFWPYWSVSPFDWSVQLDRGLATALRDPNIERHQDSLQRMMATVPDGHVSVTCPGKNALAMAALEVEEVEGKLLVTVSGIPELVAGDEVLDVDGVAAMQRRNDLMDTHAGSLHYRKALANAQLTEGQLGTQAYIRVRRGDKLVTVKVVRNGAGIAQQRPAVARQDDGTYYVDLSRVSRVELGPIINDLATAPGVVFDMRVRPRDGEYVLSHLLTRPMGDEKWAAWPHIIRPDHVENAISSWTLEGWNLPMEAPRIAGRVAFLVGPRTLSLPEVLLGYISSYRLGEIVGSTSAGTNGNAAAVAMPSGCQSWFTGLRVTKLDGSQFHMVGFAPTIPVMRTAAGVAAGRDEDLERALAYLRTGR